MRRQTRFIKHVRWSKLSSLSEYEQIVFVVGCQRSGTTLVLNCFENDHRTIVFRDESELSGFRDNRLRLKPYIEVAQILAKTRCPLIVSKPLLDSQRTLELLEQYPRSKALWILRNYLGVVGSSLRKFSGQIENVRRVLEEPDDWRAEGCSDETRNFIRRFYSTEMRREDAAALMWLSRNQLFFDNNLHQSERVAMLRYEDLVNQSDSLLRNVYEFLNLGYPSYRISKLIHRRSLSRGKTIELQPKIRAKCERLQTELIKHCLSDQCVDQSVKEPK